MIGKGQKSLFKTLCITMIIALLGISSKAYSDTANSTNYYNLLLKANNKNVDYVETITTETSIGDKKSIIKSKYKYSKNSDMAILEKVIANKESKAAITNVKDIRRKQVYLYDVNKKKYVRNVLFDVNLNKFIDINDNELKTLVNNSQIIQDKNKVTIKSALSIVENAKPQETKLNPKDNTNSQASTNGKMSEEQIAKLKEKMREMKLKIYNQKKHNSKQDKNVQAFLQDDKTSNGGKKYTITLVNGNITSAIVEESVKPSASSNNKLVNKKTTYSISYEKQDDIQKSLKGKLIEDKQNTKQNQAADNKNDSSNNFVIVAVCILIGFILIFLIVNNFIIKKDKNIQNNKKNQKNRKK